MIKKEPLLSNFSNTPVQTSAMPYVGRFAPSPSGPLHFGSLVCALASFLHAKQHQGKWLVRIEDVDTPRIDANMNESILTSLQAHGLVWDDEIIYQSQRFSLYDTYLSTLESAGLLYGCACSRRQIKARSGTYDRYCRELGLPLEDIAIRFKHDTDNRQFEDFFLGLCFIRDNVALEDPVLKRADGIHAYHLAVVVDDIEQQVTHIVRGNDLLETTPVHLSLYQALKMPVPRYLHIPIVVQKLNQKLSKQHFSPAINDQIAIENLKLALQYLGVSPNKIPNISNIAQLIDWSISHWSVKLLPKQSELLISVANNVYSAPENMLAVAQAK